MDAPYQLFAAGLRLPPLQESEPRPGSISPIFSLCATICSVSGRAIGGT